VAERILSRKHSLLINKCLHALAVRHHQPRASQFSMPVRTFLDLSHFRDVSKVKWLLEQHGMSIYCERSSELGIEGDFCDLRRCRMNLYKVLAMEDPKGPKASQYLSSEEKGRKTPQNVTDTPDRMSPSSSGLSRRQPEGRGHIAPRNHKNHPGSPSLQESSTRSTRDPTPTQAQNVSTSKSQPQTFLVDLLVHGYVRTFRQDMIDAILAQYNVDMTERSSEAFTNITLTSRSPGQSERFGEACDKIKIMFDFYTNRLRAEKIELPTNLRYSREEITRIMEEYLNNHDIFSMPLGDRCLHIIGPSDEILPFIQEWRGTGGKLAQTIIDRSVLSRPPMKSKQISSNNMDPTAPGTSDGGSSGRDTGEDVHLSTRDAAGSSIISPEEGLQESSTRSSREPTPTHVQRVPSPKSQSQSFVVDLPVHRYLRTFQAQKIEDLLTRYNVHMKEHNSEGFTNITLTSRSPEEPERFGEACDKIKYIFDYYTHRLRAERIELPTNSRYSREEITRIMEEHLQERKICIWPRASGSLCVIGPSDEILPFIQEWRGTGGKLAQTIIDRSVLSRPPMAGMKSKQISNNGNPTPPGTSDGRSRGRDTGHESHVRARDKQNGGGPSRGKPPDHNRRPSWK
ncbi:hypothetical protein GDO81_024350, partial [Engystomops pustulosus]